ncbi:MAG: hypothetical protein ACI4F9_01995 [Lachnospiraceae bacterium]
MFYVENEYIKKHILDGHFGLEKESLRVLENGMFSHTPHPFPEDKHIVKDFCENQTEINTSVHTSIKEAIEELEFHSHRIYLKLKNLPQREYLWPFSNPPYIENEKDIPVAIFEGNYGSKTIYRDYLSDKYGRYKMTFSGIHVNFSFSEELLKINYEEKKKTIRQSQNMEDSIEEDYQTYKNQLYLNLAKKMAMYGWILVAVTAASPIMDSSFVEKGIYNGDIFTGMASVRCSEMGYWNDFTPIFDYENIHAYVDGIQKYVNSGLLRSPSELYYPIRLKPRGENNLDTLREQGVDHIELRMFDLNPLVESGVEEKDILFAQLLMVWLLSTSHQTFTQKEQIQAVQNFKNAARYDLKTVKILSSDGENYSVAKSAIGVIDKMRKFYKNLGLPVQDILEFEYDKFVHPENRYAWKIREQFQEGYVKKALKLAKERQDK